MVRHLSFALILLALASCTRSPSASTPPGAPLAITVDAAHPGAAINPAMWGGFFEDINDYFG